MDAEPAREVLANGGGTAAVLRLPAADGYPLAARLFPPTGEAPRRLVVISAATGVPARFYRRYAAHLAGAGAAVLTYDYRGVGASRPASLRGFRAGLEDWVEDLDAVVRFAEERLAGLPVVLLGHSLGGVVALASAPARRAERIVTLGAQTSYWKDWPLQRRFQRFALWHLAFPLLTAVAGYLPASRLGLGEDLPQPFAGQWAACWRGPARLVETLGLEDREPISCPLIAVGVSDDTIATAAAIRRLHGLVPTRDLRYHWIDPKVHGLERLGHFDAFRQLGEGSVWAQLTRLVMGS